MHLLKYLKRFYQTTTVQLTPGSRKKGAHSEESLDWRLGTSFFQSVPHSSERIFYSWLVFPGIRSSGRQFGGGPRGSALSGEDVLVRVGRRWPSRRQMRRRAQRRGKRLRRGGLYDGERGFGAAPKDVSARKMFRRSAGERCFGQMRSFDRAVRREAKMFRRGGERQIGQLLENRNANVVWAGGGSDTYAGEGRRIFLPMAAHVRPVGKSEAGGRIDSLERARSHVLGSWCQWEFLRSTSTCFGKADKQVRRVADTSLRRRVRAAALFPTPAFFGARCKRELVATAVFATISRPGLPAPIHDDPRRGNNPLLLA